jgi:hypothetical protein
VKWDIESQYNAADVQWHSKRFARIARPIFPPRQFSAFIGLPASLPVRCPKNAALSNSTSVTAVTSFESRQVHRSSQVCTRCPPGVSHQCAAQSLKDAVKLHERCAEAAMCHTIPSGMYACASRSSRPSAPRSCASSPPFSRQPRNHRDIDRVAPRDRCQRLARSTPLDGLGALIR